MSLKLYFGRIFGCSEKMAKKVKEEINDYIQLLSVTNMDQIHKF